MSDLTFRLPDVGEGLTEAEIVQWRVSPGDTVAVNDVLVEIETAKSLVELPSPYAGVVAALLVDEGQTVDVGTAIITVGTDAAGGGAVPSAAPDAAATTATPVDGVTGYTLPPAAAQAAPAAAPEAEKPEPMLVGHGSSGGGGTRRRRTRTAPTPHEHLAPAPVHQTTATPLERPLHAASVGPVLAKPPIRKLAKDLGVDLSLVTPTGPVGDVTRDDVIREASQVSVFRNIQTPEWPETREERIPVKGVRKMIAQTMVKSAYSAPHVSLFVDVDATRTMEYVKRLKAGTDYAGIRISPLLVMAKAIIWAVRRNPTVNAQWTDEEIIVKHYVNLGIAAATPRGLIVPNVKDAQAMSMVQLASALEQLTITAREGKTSPAQMAGGTITITNIGVFGMDTGTPILNSDEVGIVALGTIKPKPWVVDGEVRVRQVTTIGASFDHRVVDGDVASRFLADVASIIEEPALLLE
ncbi:branched-chain alpha-keto acid dehydrogenase subunit E2 [Leifsonia sp. Leaf325]|nr:dihydrolipoamide acetyltransferase family protein [Leifsonia sp. Leaf325]KQQ93222.1 branched-chain alpha-keto acid dehydrogenase subunit E2 [Leifsonia sp. Leaf325]